MTTKNFLKPKKNTNKNLANTKTLSATDNFTSTCFEHPKNEKNASANRKNMLEAKEKKKQKRKKEDNYNETTSRNINNENRNNKYKTNVYVLGDSMIKKLNGYLLNLNILLKCVRFRG